MEERAILRCFAIGTVLGLAACAQPTLLEDHPLAGRIWDARAGAFVDEKELLARLPAAPRIILGEIHDNAQHHRLQRRVLDSLAPTGRRTLAMEQFDSEYQQALDAAPREAEALADAGRLDRKGWNWPLYKPLVQFALDQGWRVVAANLSRAEARKVIVDPAQSRLAPPSPELKAALEHDMVEGHCGKRPDAKRLAGMVEAQRARDARMASVMKGPTVLIAGSGHARRDRGVPLYLQDPVVSIAFTEVQAGKSAPQDYERSFDYLWFTARAVRDDPCR